METRNLTNDTTIFSTYVPFPGFGLVPVNAFLLKAQEPVLVDTQLYAEAGAFQDALRSVIDPQELRWLYLTHPHPDHIGSVKALMDEVPHLRLVTTFGGYGLLALTEQIAIDRLYLLNPGERLNVGDRELAVVKPLSFDDPSTTGFVDTKTQAFFSSDSFGALIPEPADRAEDINPAVLVHGQSTWTKFDSPWLHTIDEGKFAAQMKAIAAIQPSSIYSSHLPPAGAMIEPFLKMLASVPAQDPFDAPNQAGLEAMLAQMGVPA
jgi:flavorubredoxin